VKRELVLVRHAKTEQSNPDGDHARELKDRGLADARAAGAWLLEEVGVPDLVLVSTAARAQQTWDQMGAGTALEGAEVWRDRRVYNAPPDALLDVVREAPEHARCVLLVGHAPGVPSLAAGLADEDRSSGDALAAVHEGFATMACAVLDVDSDWAKLAPGSAGLRLVVTPRGTPDDKPDGGRS
jgi:phosphohistidine phosphatase